MLFIGNDCQVESYFDQAFLKEDEIGAGDFGRVFRVRSRVGSKLSVWWSDIEFVDQVDQKVYAVKIARERYRGPTDRARKLEEVKSLCYSTSILMSCFVTTLFSSFCLFR